MMALKGDGVLVMWWDIADGCSAEFEKWHSGEHLLERLSVPGFLGGSRWVSVTGTPHYFVMYELTALKVLESDHYRNCVNHPTPQTTRVMSYFRNMVRSQCIVRGSVGSSIAQAMLTVRFSPHLDRVDHLQRWLIEQRVPALMAEPNIVGVHLIENAVPAVPLEEQTTEQKLRGGDATADWVLLVASYDLETIVAMAGDENFARALEQNGALPGSSAGVYRLAHSMG